MLTLLTCFLRKCYCSARNDLDINRGDVVRQIRKTSALFQFAWRFSNDKMSPKFSLTFYHLVVIRNSGRHQWQQHLHIRRKFHSHQMICLLPFLSSCSSIKKWATIRDWIINWTQRVVYLFDWSFWMMMHFFQVVLFFLFWNPL